MFPTDQILQGDCTRVLRALPDASVDLVVTDPPYGVRYRDRLNRTIANDDCPERILGAFNDVYRVLKPDTFCVSFYGWNRVDAFLAAWRRASFIPVGHLVWQKNYASSRSFLEARHGPGASRQRGMRSAALRTMRYSAAFSASSGASPGVSRVLSGISTSIESASC